MIHPTAIIGDPPEHRDWDERQMLFDPLIAADARINAYVTVDAGMHAPTRIGAGSWLMKHVHVGHDAIIGERCELAPGVVIGGHCEIGDGVRMGVNACVRPFIKIGAGARIGAGAVVVKHVPAGEVWAGNPARPLKPRSADELTELERRGWEEWWQARQESLELADVLAGDASPEGR